MTPYDKCTLSNIRSCLRKRSYSMHAKNSLHAEFRKKIQKVCKWQSNCLLKKNTGASGFTQWTIRLHPLVQFLQQGIRNAQAAVADAKLDFRNVLPMEIRTAADR